jgi:hypothetical protein
MHGPAVAEAVAGLITAGATSALDLELLRPDRFSRLRESASIADTALL